MFRKTLLFLTLSASLLFAVSCDDDDDSAPSMEITEVETEYYGLFCDALMQCNINPYFDLVITDEASCLDFLDREIATDANSLGNIIAKVDEGTVVYDGEAAYACIEAMGPLACDEFGDMEPEPCRGVFTGTIEVGGACDISAECLDGWCDTSEGCPGTCVAAVAEGGSCDDTEECVTGAKCIDGSCAFFVSPVAAGGACDPEEDWCATGTFCHPDSMECTAQVAEDSPCEEVSDNECEAGTLCFAIGENDPTCMALTIAENVDDECDVQNGVMCAIYNDLVCSIDDFQNFTGVCAVSRKLDELCFDAENTIMTGCNEWDDLYCDMSGGFTEDAYCAAKKADGVSCSEDEECLSDLCEGDVCVNDDTEMCM